MRSFILRRVLLLFPLLLGITFATFMITKAIPGDPVFALVGERADAHVIEKIREEIGSDRNPFRQYMGYLSLLADGEMGRSYYTNRKVMDDIKAKFPHTLRLAAGAMGLAVPAGVLCGFLAAVRRGTVTDRMISAASVAGLSIPVFWSGLLLMLLFSLHLKLLPPSGTGGLRYLLLPALTLSLPAVALLVRVTRSAVLEVVEQPYLRTARAKGLRGLRIGALHIMKNALIPVVTVIGLEFGSYLNGAVLTETIFGWDGIGRFMMEGIVKRDYPVIMGCIMVGTVVFVMVNLLVDILYHFIDPRVRIHGTDR